MAGKAARTREKILDAAQRIVMHRGFGATSVDMIQEEAGISRGTFFYHFSTKANLARALLMRYAESDRELVDTFMARAETLARDPLQQVQVFLGLHEELFRAADHDPGCLFASYSYEAGLFDQEAHAVVDASIRHWREVLGGKLAAAMERWRPQLDTDPYVLADLAYGVLQGAFILSRTRSDRSVLIDHLRHLRNYLDLLLGPADQLAGLVGRADTTVGQSDSRTE